MWQAYFREGRCQMCCTMWSTVYLSLSTVGLFERLHLFEGAVGKSEAEFTCGCICVWRGCDEVVNVGIDGE